MPTAAMMDEWMMADRKPDGTLPSTEFTSRVPGIGLTSFRARLK
jgi:hypothetical protein